MGYSTDDLDARHDEKGWTWETLIDQPRLLTETSSLMLSFVILSVIDIHFNFCKVWKKILPQLEETLHMRKPLHQIINRKNRKNLIHSIEVHFTLILWRLEDTRGKADQIESINLATLYKQFPAFQANARRLELRGPSKLVSCFRVLLERSAFRLG